MHRSLLADRLVLFELAASATANSPVSSKLDISSLQTFNVVLSASKIRESWIFDERSRWPRLLRACEPGPETMRVARSVAHLRLARQTVPKADSSGQRYMHH